MAVRKKISKSLTRKNKKQLKKSSLVERLKKTLARTKKNTKLQSKLQSKLNKKKASKKKLSGGGVGMPIEYFGGESSAWIDDAMASVSKPLDLGYTWNDFSSVTPSTS
jgi:hypothetical protein